MNPLTQGDSKSPDTNIPVSRNKPDRACSGLCEWVERPILSGLVKLSKKKEAKKQSGGTPILEQGHPSLEPCRSPKGLGKNCSQLCQKTPEHFSPSTAYIMGPGNTVSTCSRTWGTVSVFQSQQISTPHINSNYIPPQTQPFKNHPTATGRRLKLEGVY